MEPVVIKEGIGQNEELAIFQPEKLSSGTPVIFLLHGNWATYRRWENYGRHFSDNGFLVLAPTYRHHYRGNGNNSELGRTSIKDYAADIMRLIRILYIDGLGDIRHIDGLGDIRLPTYPIFIGHSMGGLVAQMIAASGIRTRGLVLLNSAPPAGISLHADDDYARRMKRCALQLFLGKPYLPDLESLSLYVYNGMPLQEHSILYQGAVCESGTASREIIAGSGSGLPRLLAKLLSRPIVIAESRVTSPMLIIGCGKDKIIAEKIAEDLHRKYRVRPQPTTLRIFPQFAHWPQVEPGWQESADYILEWLNYLLL